MDIFAIKPNTQKIDIRHPGSGSPIGFVIEVGSIESDAVKKVDRKHLDKQLRNRGKKPSSAEFEANMIERLAATVVGWEFTGDASLGGERPDFSREMAAKVLETAWLRNQVREVVEDEAAFFEN